MRYKPQILTDDVLKCAFDKYVKTHQDIWGKRRSQTSFSGIKLLQKLDQFYTIFNAKNIFSSCCYTKENFKINETCQNGLRERPVRPPGRWSNLALIHPMSYKPKIFINVVLQCLVDKYVITYQNIWSDGGDRHHGAIVTVGHY